MATSPRPSSKPSARPLGQSSADPSANARGTSDADSEGKQENESNETADEAQELAQDASEQDADNQRKASTAQFRRASQAGDREQDAADEAHSHYHAMLKEHYAEESSAGDRSIQEGSAVLNDGGFQQATIEDGHYGHGAMEAPQSNESPVGDALSQAHSEPAIEHAASIEGDSSSRLDTLARDVDAAQYEAAASEIRAYDAAPFGNQADEAQALESTRADSMAQLLESAADAAALRASEAGASELAGEAAGAQNSTAEGLVEGSVAESEAGREVSSTRDIENDIPSAPDANTELARELSEVVEPSPAWQTADLDVAFGAQSSYGEAERDIAPRDEAHLASIDAIELNAGGEKDIRPETAERTLDGEKQAAEHMSENDQHHIEPSMSELSNAIADHLVTHGMSAEQAHTAVHAVEGHLDAILENPASSHGTSLVFHQGETPTVAIEHHMDAQGSHGSIAIPMETLAHIHANGVPTEGVEAIRQNLQEETKGMSTVDVLHHYGHDVATAIQSEGFPRAHVETMQNALKEQASSLGYNPDLVTAGHALQALGANVREETPHLEFLDEHTGHAAPIDNNQLVDQMTHAGHYSSEHEAAHVEAPSKVHQQEMQPPQL